MIFIRSAASTSVMVMREYCRMVSFSVLLYLSWKCMVSEAFPSLCMKMHSVKQNNLYSSWKCMVLLTFSINFHGILIPSYAGVY